MITLAHLIKYLLRSTSSLWRDTDVHVHIHLTTTLMQYVSVLLVPQARFLEFKIQNMVGSCDVKFPIRLEGLVVVHSQFARYSRTNCNVWGNTDREIFVIKNFR